jgi:acyl-CoA thioesterase I
MRYLRTNLALGLLLLPALAAAAVPHPAPLPAASSGPPIVIFLGDSLTAGLGLDAAQAYPAILGSRFAAQGKPLRVINAGVSGDTTAGGLRRLAWLLKQKPEALVVGLGANDGLRGVPLVDIERNLREIVRRSQAAGVRVLLLGMQIPPNYGPAYAGGFTAMYPRIAKDLDVPLVPFLLKDVGGVPELNQADGIHPTAVGQRKVADTVYPYLRDLLAPARSAAGR